MPKDHFEQCKDFGQQLDLIVDVAREKYDLSYEAVIGALYLKAHALAEESMRPENHTD